MSGFAAAHRSLTEHHLFKGDSARLGAWIWLFMRAAWKPLPFSINGKTITLERGQLCVSLRQLAEEWGWSKSSVDRFLTRLETETMIERKAGQGRCIITICNYEKYQAAPDVQRDSSGTLGGTAAGQQRDTKEQINKGTSISPKGDCASGDAPARPVDEFTASDFVESWNAVADAYGLQKIRKMTDGRKRAFRVRKNEYPDIADWKAAFRCLTENKWMHGDNRTGWRADPDFFLQAKSFTKLVEGQYGQADR